MKKMISVLFAAVMMAAGLAAFGISPANADCPYSGCIPTSTSIDAPSKVERGDTARICVSVEAERGNATPKGKVSITVIRANGGYKFSDVKQYNDGRECFTTTKLTEKGNYIIKARFDRKPDSRWKDSDNRAEFRVVRR